MRLNFRHAHGEEGHHGHHGRRRIQRLEGAIDLMVMALVVILALGMFIGLVTGGGEVGWVKSL